MMNSFPAMRDEAAIPHLTRTRQEDGTVCYFSVIPPFELPRRKPLEKST